MVKFVDKLKMHFRIFTEVAIAARNGIAVRALIESGLLYHLNS